MALTDQTAVRLVEYEKVTAVDQSISITADPKDIEHGNASHHYTIWFYNGDANLSDRQEPAQMGAEIHFQDGPISEVGVNGIGNEALLAVVIDRLRSFQTSQFSCRENAMALTKVEEALHWLNARTRERRARGVEGTYQK